MTAATKTDQMTLRATTDYNPKYPPQSAKKGYVARISGRAAGAVKYEREFLGDEVTLLEGDEGLYERQRGDKKGGCTRWYHVMLDHPEYGLILSRDCEGELPKIAKMLDDGYAIEEIVYPEDIRPSERIEGRMMFTARVRTAAEIKRLRRQVVVGDKTAKVAAVAEIRRLMAEHDITTAEIEEQS